MFLIFAANRTFAQLIDEKNVTITMDLQPILQLNMTTPDQIDFVFDKISDYYSGVTKYGATILKVSSTVTWDLYAVGVSNGGTNFWDYQQQYGSAAAANGINQIPLSALELHQYGANNFHGSYAGPANRQDYHLAFNDYTAPFVPAMAGQNSVYYAANPYTAPTANDKYIQGCKGTVITTDGAPGGSYLTAPAVAGSLSNYYFVIDYRIFPGLPAIFPFAGPNSGVPAQDLVTANAAGNYAQPGIYTMDLKFVLLEDQ